MFGEKFYNGMIRKYVIYFGTLFNDIEIDRTNSSNTVVQTIRVPITYGPKEKYLAQLDQNPNLDRKLAIQLPIMSFEMTSFSYSAERRLNPTHRLYNNINKADRLRSVYTPTPFDIGFQLNVYVRNAEDGVRILEQILPYFTPEYTATLKLLDNMPDIKMDVPVVFNNLSTEDTYEGDYETRRALIHTLDFTVKGFMFGPVRERKGLIRMANTQFFVDNSNEGEWNLLRDDPNTTISIKPGQLANGQAISTAGITAKALASLSTGSVSSIDVIVRGKNYANATVTIASPNSQQATAIATISSGLVTDIDITSAGGFYNAPPITIISGDRTGGSGTESYTETLTSTITNGVVTSISLPTTNNIISATIDIANPPNVTATAAAIVGVDGKISSINVTDGGAGYLVAPVVTISAPDIVPVDKTLVAANSTYGYIIEITDNE